MRRYLTSRGALVLMLSLGLVGFTGCDQPQPAAGRKVGHLADSDGDGVDDGDDRCEGTQTDHVNAVGCPDQDLDGIEDEADQCPDTASGAAVDENGCPFPRPDTEWTPERRVSRIATPAERERFLFSSMILPQPLNCPGDMTAPNMPVITEPALRGIEFDRPFVVDGHNEVTIRWDPVQDPCTPVRYTIEWEYRAVGSSESWQPMVGWKQRTTDTEITVDWQQQDTWARYRIWAMDNNGHNSEKTAWHYFLLSDHPPSEARFSLPRYP